MGILERLAEAEEELRALEAELGNTALAGTRRYAELSQRYARLRELVDHYTRLKALEREMAEAEEMLATEADPELRELIAEELREYRERHERLQEEIQALLVPEDARDLRNAIVEIRAGAGGEESALFAADLFRMYQKYAERKGLKIDVMDSHPTPLLGFKSIIFAVEGRGAYGLFKFESGVHRVQRVPVTEASGRIHTSTASVAVLPETEEVELEIDEEELEIETFRSSGPGGQHANRTESAVRITHKPTGLVVTCQDARSQHKNKEKALKILRARLKERLEEEKAEELTSERRSQIGRAMRSEKVRTYNFPQNRVTDHRIDLTLYQLEEILAGDLDPLVSALAKAEREERLAAVLAR
ncbi:MAG: peptide chain release factor 1 [Candidatus Acetothermia bacterium]|jgi:peptide chain release factor 1|nr:peptide chain release factor 1 [Candidatus Acetothermia bacterium]MDH7505707.1 peptide chain release factor 1 [Candidatus Acetothermia bacterium]